jgi:hypothetical protein
MTGESEVYSTARRVLLDALEALGGHRAAVILVGAQAVYLRTEPAATRRSDDPVLDIAISPYTSDGDLALEPSGLAREPLLDHAMRSGHFEPHPRDLGRWLRDDVAVDLLVPAAAVAGRRGARLGVHGKHVARRAEGLEAALADSSRLRVAALDPEDGRAFDIRVAGSGALVVAKAHKLMDRSGEEDRLRPKDALDLYRLLKLAPRREIETGLRAALREDVARTVTEAALDYLGDAFTEPDAPGVGYLEIALAAVSPDARAIEVASCQALARELHAALR